MRRFLRPVRAGLMLAAVPSVALAQPGGDVAPAAAAAAERMAAAQAMPGEFKDAEALLNALESADKDLVSLTADVKYDRTFEIQGDRQVRLGKLYFVVDPPAPDDATKTPRKRFAIKFDRLYVGEVVRDEHKTYIFDGQWLMEKDQDTKFFMKRQVVPPGEHFDPLKIGEGPFVLPIGQKKADIDRRYTVQLLPTNEGIEPAADATEPEKRDAERLKGDVAGSWQLKLTAKPEFAPEEEFSEIRLWYKRGAKGELLPRLARTVNKAGDVAVVLLTNTELQLVGKPENKDAAVPAAVVDTTAPEGWDGRIEPFRKHATGEDEGKREGPDVGDK